MERATVETVEALCQHVAGLCKLILDEAKKARGAASAESIYYIGPNPRAAQLKRESMNLTRALARLRGRGRF